MKKVLSILLLLNCAVLNANFEAIEAYQRSMIEEEITAALCLMDYQEPLIFHGALNLEGPTLTSAVEQYRDYLINF